MLVNFSEIWYASRGHVYVWVLQKLELKVKVQVIGIHVIFLRKEQQKIS